MNSIERSVQAVFPGGGEMGALLRRLDWSKTALGPVSDWPQSLLTTISTCIDCAFPILIWWGPKLVMLYNDEYRSILGSEKHPRALGAAGQEVWPEIWDIIGPMLNQVVQTGQATRSRDLLLLMNRNGFEEEAYFSFSYSPIRDETGGVGGVFTPVIETTASVVGERRLRTLRELRSYCPQRVSPPEAMQLLGAWTWKQIGACGRYMRHCSFPARYASMTCVGALLMHQAAHGPSRRRAPL